MRKQVTVPEEIILSKIYEIRGEKVMLDKDLAELYQVETKVLKQAVRRNAAIFPAHFMFELTNQENMALRSQIVTSNKGKGGTRYLPMVFTEHGVLQLASVLRSDRAKHMSIRLIEIFVKLRALLSTHKELLLQTEKVGERLAGHDKQIAIIFEYLKQLEQTKQEGLSYKNRKRIGFKQEDQ